MKKALASARTQNTGSFEDKVFSLLDRTEYRIIRTPEDFEEIGRLRKRAYDKKQVYTHKFEEPLIDEVDHDPASRTYGIYIDEILTASVRLHVLTPEHRVSPALDMFPSHLNPLLDQGLRFIDPSRFTVDLERARDLPGLPHVTLRPAVMATRYFDADYCLSCVKREHASFYRRTFRATAVAGPIRHPEMMVDAVLFASTRASFADICDRYPFYSYMQQEAELLFGKPKADEPWPLTILPTARMALRRNTLAA